MNLTEIIDAIPKIIDYFLPGYVFLVAFAFFTSSKNTLNEIYHIVACVVISKLILLFDGVIWGFINYLHREISNYPNLKMVLVSISSLVYAILLALVVESDWLNKFCSLINNKSVHDDAFRNTLDYNGSTLMMTCDDDTVITGRLAYYEEKGEDSWFVLEDYVIGDQVFQQDKPTNNFHRSMMIRLRNTKRIEVYKNS